jgi:hypothetical protein
MKKSEKDVQTCLDNDTIIAACHGSIQDMVTALLARTDPDGYATMLAELRAEWKPVSWDAQIVELMAGLACRIRGCDYLEAEILNRNIEGFSAQYAQETALARAFIRDFEGPNLLNKLSRYQSRLQTEFARCIRILTRHAASRRHAEEMAAATLAKRKPCTSVIQ